MRPLEILLIAVNLLSFSGLTLARLRDARWGHWLLLIAAPVAGAQALAGGPHWQMIPAYVLSLVFFLASLVLGHRPMPPYARQSRRRQAVTGLSFGLIALGLAASAALPFVFPLFRFPRPHGKYGIGSLTYHWLDDARQEAFTDDPNDRRELIVQIWYPAREDPSAPRVRYIEDGNRLGPLASLLRVPGFLFGHLHLITTNAMPSVPVAPDEARYPVLIFLHGRGGYRQHNTAQVEELVSHGYIVAAIDQPYAASTVVFPDGRRIAFDTRFLDSTFAAGIVPFLAQDTSFVLDQLAALNRSDPNGILTGRLDVQRAGIFGVSLGGIVSTQACHQEPRLKACLSIDAPVPDEVAQTGLEQPTQFITRDAETMRQEGWPQEVIDDHLFSMSRLFENLGSAGYFVQLPGAFHQDFSDSQLLVWPPLAARLGIVGPIDGKRARQIVGDFSLAFFDRHLKGYPAPLLDSPEETYPDVLFKVHQSSPAAV